MSAIYKNFQTSTGSELERLFAMGFKDCAQYISKMDTMKKADVAAQIQPVLESLYAQTDRYGNPDYPLEDQIGPDIFIYVMGKIKRWETILYWLYEIDILMNESELDRMIQAAERKLEANDYEDFLVGKVIEAPRKRPDPKKSEMVKKTVYVSGKEQLYDMYAEREARGNHTEEIMDAAKDLAAKYFASGKKA